jgi:tetratricopeptide (TPR) repeat protein
VLVKKLDGLPLALATAGSYLHQVSTSLTEYNQLYEASWAELQETTPRLTSYDKTLYSTWQISFDHVIQRNNHSAQLLRLWAFFDNQDLWFELLQHTSPEDPDWFLELTRNNLTFSVAVRVLCDHGLVDTDLSQHNQTRTGMHDQIGSRGYNMHACVHSWISNVLNQRCYDHLGKLALKLVAAHAPKPDHPLRWQIQRRLMPHATRCADFISNNLGDEDGMESEIQALGMLLCKQRRLDGAKTLLQRALRAYLKADDPGDLRIPDTINQLGLIGLNLGDQEQAELMFELAIRRYDQALGSDHVAKLCPMINLGIIRREQNRPDEAAKLFTSIWKKYDEEYGPNNESSSMAICNLAFVYKEMGEYGEAEKLLLLGLQGYEQSFGQDHESTIKTISYLGDLYLNDLHQLEDAERMHWRAVQGYEKIFGLDNLSTIDAIDSLGIAFARQNKTDEAERRYYQALTAYKETLGQDHPSTLSCMYRLGLIYSDQDRLDDAAAVFKQAWEGYEKTQGLNYIPTLKSIHQLGLVKERQGKLSTAEQLLQVAREGYATVAASPDLVLGLLRDLGNVYRSNGELDKSEEMYRQVLQDCGNSDCDCDSAKNALCNLNQIYYQRFDSFKHDSQKESCEIYLKIFKETVVSLSGLCESHGRLWPSIVLTFARLLLLLGYTGEAGNAFHYYSCLMSDQDDLNLECNGCSSSLPPGSEWFICVTCREVDLCKKCHMAYEANAYLSGELINMEDCRSHAFIAVSRAGRGDPGIDINPLESSRSLWLTSIHSWRQIMGQEP